MLNSKSFDFWLNVYSLAIILFFLFKTLVLLKKNEARTKDRKFLLRNLKNEKHKKEISLVLSTKTTTHA